MAVTEIILAKASRLCQLSSLSRLFLSRLWIFKPIGPTLKKTDSFFHLCCTKIPLILKYSVIVVGARRINLISMLKKFPSH